MFEVSMKYILLKVLKYVLWIITVLSSCVLLSSTLRNNNLSFWVFIFSSFLLYWLYKKQKENIYYKMNSQWMLAEEFNNSPTKDIVSAIRGLLWKRDLKFWKGINIHYHKSANGYIEQIINVNENSLPFSLSDFINNLDESSLNSINEIYIDDSQYANEIIHYIPINKLKNLREIVFEGFDIDSKSIEKLAYSKMPNLRSLSLKNLRLNDFDLMYLCKDFFECPNLEELNLSGNSITDLGITYLQNSKLSNRLKSIDLNNNILISDLKSVSRLIVSKKY